MKKLSQTQLSQIQGGELTAAEACGIGAGILVASLFTGVGVIWGAAAFAATCLVGDSSQ
jgi:bacteriocin-like protein